MFAIWYGPVGKASHKENLRIFSSRAAWRKKRPQGNRQGALPRPSFASRDQQIFVSNQTENDPHER
jgi:hypothetical protein